MNKHIIKKLSILKDLKKHYVVLILVSLSIFAIQIISLKSSTSLFGLDHRFILVSLAAAGLGFGAFFFYLINEKLQIVISMYKVLLLFLANVFTFLFIPYIFFYTDKDPNIVLFIGVLLTLYSVVGFILTKIFYYNINKFPLYYSIHLFSLGAGLLFVLLLIPFGYLVLSITLVTIVSGALLVELPISIKKKGVLSIILIAFYFLTIFYIHNENIDVTIPCNKNDAKKLVASKDNFFSHVRLFKNGNAYSAVYGCVRRTSVLEYDDKVKEQLKGGFYTIPYEFTDNGSVVIIGAGAGLEAERALSVDYSNITTIEINKDIINLVKANVKGSHNPYNDTSVDLIIGEGRRELLKLNKKFDLVYIPHSGRYGLLGVNSFNSVPNYLFTSEAMNLYYNKLAEDGVLALAVNGYFVHFNIETLISSLKNKGLDSGEIILIQTKYSYKEILGILGSSNSLARKTDIEKRQLSERSMVLFKKGGFSDKEIGIIKNRIEDTDIFTRITFDKEYTIDNSFVTSDNRPYYTVKQIFADSSNIEKYKASFNQKDIIKEYIVPTITQAYVKLSVIPLALSLMTIALFWYVRRKRVVIKKIAGVSTFFFLVALAFMFLELGYLNKLFLILDNPILAFGILLFIFILSSGIGSLIAYFKENFVVKYLKLIMIALGLLVVIQVPFLSSIVSYANNISLISKLLILTFLAGIPALLSGMIFPIGVKLISFKDNPAMIFVYLLDSFVSVFAGIIALIISTIVGFDMLLIAGALSYLAALFFVDSLKDYTHQVESI